MATKLKPNAERGGQELTAQPFTVPASNGATPLRDSETFRLPKPKGRCPLSGLSRTSLLEYGESGCFKLIRLRKRGAARGVVLVDTASFLRWLHGQPAVTKEDVS
jgi:hypothetical protein